MVDARDFANTPSGGLDPTFGKNGAVIINGSLNNLDEAYFVHEDSAGRILVAGRVSVTGGVGDAAVLRFLPNGSLDTSFATNGIYTSVLCGNYYYVNEDSMGNIVVTGNDNTAGCGGDGIILVTVLDSTGTPIYNYNSLLTRTSEVRGFQMANDDIYSFSTGAGSINLDLGITKHRYNGSNYELDTSYGGGDGILENTVDPYYSPRAIQYDSVSGDFYMLDGNFVFYRIDLNGGLVSTMSTGTADRYYGPGMVDHANSRIVVPFTVFNVEVGWTAFNISAAANDYNAASEDLWDDGIVNTSTPPDNGYSYGTTLDGRWIDTSMGDNGSASTNTLHYDSLLDSNGKYVIAGYETTGNQNALVQRLNSDFSPDTTFNSTSFTTVDIAGSPDQIRHIIEDSQGRYLAVGLANNGSNNDILVLRIKP